MESRHRGAICREANEPHSMTAGESQCVCRGGVPPPMQNKCNILTKYSGLNSRADLLNSLFPVISDDGLLSAGSLIYYIVPAVAVDLN